MAQRCKAGLAALAFLILCGNALGQTLSITGYQLVSQTPVSATQYRVQYSATLVNTGGALAEATATVSSTDLSIRPLNGLNILTFGRVPANGQAQSTNTITLLITGAPPPDFSLLRWTFQSRPQNVIADAGTPQYARVGDTANLDGSKSSNPVGIGTLTYSWKIISRPVGPGTRLMNPTTPFPSFFVDAIGQYVLQLTVSNGVDTDTATTTVNSDNVPPVANAGQNQTVAVGATVTLNGSGSTDGNGDSLTYAWQFVSVPPGSTATLSSPTAVSPTFLADRAGEYIVQLTVNDGKVSSPVSTVVVTTTNTKPVANAGANVVSPVGTAVHLDGSTSFDADGNALSYSWALITRPNGSTAALNSPTSVTPSFTPDVAGIYIAQLIVNDGTVSSDPSTVTISTNPVLAPTANAGSAQYVPLMTGVNLTGGGTDPQGLRLTYQWALISKPQGSAATLSDSSIQNPSFVPDIVGTYIAQLIVNNGYLNSAASTVQIFGGMGYMQFQPSILDASSGSVSATLLLSTAAGPGGEVVNLVSSNPNVASVPATITVLQGNMHANVVITRGTANGTATITATAASYTSATATVHVSLPNLNIALDAADNLIGLTKQATGTLTLSAPAASPVIVTLSDSPAGIVQLSTATITIPAGGTTATFTVTGLAVGSATIAGSATGYSSAALPVSVYYIGQIKLPAALGTVGLGESVPLALSLVIPAGPDGVTVNLVSSDPGKITITPPSVSIPFRSNTPAVPPMVTGLALGSATISASSPGMIGASQTFQVNASVTLAPASLAFFVNDPVKFLTLTLSSPAPAGGLVVNVSSSNPKVASVPGTVLIAAGSKTATIAVTPGAAGSAVISASALPAIPNVTANVAVQSLGSVVTPSSLSVQVGQPTAFPVHLSMAAPSGGVTIALASSTPSVATVSPSTVNIAQGQQVPAAQPVVIGVAAGSTAITASAPYWNSGTGSVTVTPITYTLAFSPPAVTITASGSLNLTLAPAAPASGLTVNLTSGNTGVATVPPTVFFPAGATSASVPVTGVAQGQASITASTANIGPAVATVTVEQTAPPPVPKDITIPTVSVGVGQTVPFPITLTQPAPAGGVYVTLTSSNTSIATLKPSTVIIPQGATTLSTVKATGVASGTATITATSIGLTSSPGQVVVGTGGGGGQPTLTFVPSSVSMAPGTTQNLNLNLSAPAGSGGLVVTLGSNNQAAVTVPASVTIGQGSATALVPVNAVSTGSATITASATGVTPATASVAVSSQPAQPTLIAPAQVTVQLNTQTALTVNLSSPAPAGGILVTLSSSDTNKVTVSPGTILIPQGSSSSSLAKVTGVSVGSAVVTAASIGYTSAATQVNVSSSAFLSFSAAAPMTVGEVQSVNLSLSSPAPGGLVVPLTSSNTQIATVPATVTFPPNSVLITVPITAVAPGSATISATALNTLGSTASIAVSGTAAIMVPSTLPISIGGTATLSVTLSAAAPAGGVTVTLVTSDASHATVSPASIFFAQGSTTPNITPVVTGVALGNAVITASAGGLGTSATTALVGTSSPLGASIGVTPANLTITAGATQGLTFILTSPAPAGGIQLQLSSNNPAAAGVPASATIAQNTTTLTVPVSGIAPGTGKILAAVPLLGGTIAVPFTVVNTATVIVPDFQAVGYDWTVDYPVQLSVPAPAGGVTVNLSSAQTKFLTITPSVFIPAGQTTPAVQPKITSVPNGSSLTCGCIGYVMVTASAQGYTSMARDVLIADEVRISLPGSFHIGLGESTPFPVAFPRPTPVGGAVVTLVSSDPSRIAVQPTVFIPEGKNNPIAHPLITGVNIGPASIDASAAYLNQTSDTKIVRVAASTSFVPSTLTLTGNSVGTITLQISGPAPAGGLTFTLSSTAPSVAGVPSTATVPQNATSVNIPVSGSSPGQASISAYIPNVFDVSTAVATITRQ